MGSLAIALVAAAVVTVTTVHGNQVRAAAEAALEKHHAEKVEQQRVQAAAEAKARLAQAHEDALASLADGAEAAKSSAAWADRDALAALRSAMTDLSSATKGDSLTPLLFGIDEVRSRISDLGTEDDALDRKYVDARIAAGLATAGDDEQYAIASAREYCATLSEEYGSDPKSAYPRYVGIAISEDLQAVEVYCPKFQSAVDYAARVIPADGGYAVEAAPSGARTAAQTVLAGSYRTAGAPSECYWEINDQHGNIIDNNFVMSAPGGITVSLSAGQGFDSRGCGEWIPAG